MNAHTKVYTFYYNMWHIGTGDNFGPHQMHLFCYQKDRIRSRSVSVHSDLSYDASHAHRRDRGDNLKIDIFCLSPRGL